MDKFTTTKVAKDFAQSSAVILEKTPSTALVFKPEIHPGGVRGKLIRFKKASRGNWTQEDVSASTHVTLPANSKIEIELKTETVQKLQQAIEERQEISRQGIKSGTRGYIVAAETDVIILKDSNKRAIFESILKKNYSDEFWKLLRDSEPELATRLSVGHLHAEKLATLEVFRRRLAGTYPETKGSDSWQAWIYANNWLFGINYIKAIEKAKINISGQMPDFLFLTADHFVDVLEIKLPSAPVLVKDDGHTATYKWSGETNEAIGQVVQYLSEIEAYQGMLEKEIERVYGVRVSLIRPRAYILIGDTKGWDKYKHAALRKLNFSLHGIQILTYSDLLQRGAEIANMYKGQVEEVKETDMPF